MIIKMSATQKLFEEKLFIIQEIETPNVLVQNNLNETPKDENQTPKGENKTPKEEPKKETEEKAPRLDISDLYSNKKVVDDEGDWGQSSGEFPHKDKLPNNKEQPKSDDKHLTTCNCVCHK